MSLVRKALRSAIVVRAVAFGNPDGSIWGAGLDAGAPVVVATGGAEPVATAIAWNADGPEWGLSGDRVALAVSPISEPEHQAGDDMHDDAHDDAPPSPAVAGVREPAWAGQQELCRVTGTVAGAEIDCVGVRTELTQVRSGELGSVRGFSSWVSAEEAVTLLALRSESEAHHDRDLVAATVFDPDGWMTSNDPRLSTTYDGDGNPTRATLELWIAQGEREFPRRAAGEAAGPAVTVAGEDATLWVLPLRCHSRGHDGAGVYLLASV
ncbi:MAG: hypothetical protein WAL22_24010 [Solirubrobacteraceae bacterium]